MGRRRTGSGGMPERGVRFRSFVHYLEEARGLDRMADGCPFEEACDTTPNGPLEFKVLAAARRFAGARPYLRGHRPMAFACLATSGPVCWACPMAKASRPGQPFLPARPAYVERRIPGASPAAPQGRPRPYERPAVAVPSLSPRGTTLEPEPLLRSAGSSSGRRTIP